MPISVSPIRAERRWRAASFCGALTTIRAVTRAAQLDMGLLFVCFQPDPQTVFVAVQRRLNGEPLEEYIKPVGGGFFFVPPGIPSPSGYLGEGLLATA